MEKILRDGSHVKYSEQGISQESVIRSNFLDLIGDLNSLYEEEDVLKEAFAVYINLLRFSGENINKTDDEFEEIVITHAKQEFTKYFKNQTIWQKSEQ